MEEEKDLIISDGRQNEIILSETEDLPKVIGVICKKDCQKYRMDCDVKNEIKLDVENNQKRTDERCEGEFIFLEMTHIDFINYPTLSFYR